MEKLLLISVLLATIVLPTWTAGDQDPQRGLRKLIASFCVFTCLYVLALLVIYPRLLG
jgi:hypothetical protein